MIPGSNFPAERGGPGIYPRRVLERSLLLSRHVKLGNQSLWIHSSKRQGEYREALNPFGQATDTDPEFTNAWYNKSLALVHLGKDIEALRALDKVLKLNPQDKEAQSQRELIVRKMANVSKTWKKDSHPTQSQLRV